MSGEERRAWGALSEGQEEVLLCKVSVGRAVWILLALPSLSTQLRHRQRQPFRQLQAGFVFEINNHSTSTQHTDGSQGKHAISFIAPIMQYPGIMLCLLTQTQCATQQALLFNQPPPLPCLKPISLTIASLSRAYGTCLSRLYVSTPF